MQVTETLGAHRARSWWHVRQSASPEHRCCGRNSIDRCIPEFISQSITVFMLYFNVEVKPRRVGIVQTGWECKRTQGNFLCARRALFILLHMQHRNINFEKVNKRITLRRRAEIQLDLRKDTFSSNILFYCIANDSEVSCHDEMSTFGYINRSWLCTCHNVNNLKEFLPKSADTWIYQNSKTKLNHTNFSTWWPRLIVSSRWVNKWDKMLHPWHGSTFDGAHCAFTCIAVGPNPCFVRALQ